MGRFIYFIAVCLPFSGVTLKQSFYIGEVVDYRSCPSCGATSFFSALNGDKVVFNVSDTGALITDPDEAFDDVLSDIDMWQIHCSGCVWSGPVHDLRLESILKN